jgi:hypothetical protein
MARREGCSLCERYRLVNSTGCERLQTAVPTPHPPSIAIRAVAADAAEAKKPASFDALG